MIHSDSNEAIIWSIVNLAICPFCGGDDSTDNACQSPKVYMDRFRGAHGGNCIRVACACGALGKGFDLAMPNAREAELMAVSWWNTRHAGARHPLGSGAGDPGMLTGADYAAGDGLTKE